MLSPLLFDTAKQGGASVPVKLKNCGFGALKSDVHIPPGTLTPVTTGLAFDWLLMRMRPVSQVICLGLGSFRSVVLSALDVDSYHFCGSRDLPGNHSCFLGLRY